MKLNQNSIYIFLFALTLKKPTNDRELEKSNLKNVSVLQ
jgi:hypothetical protein